jgi:hypothetical protein
MQIINESDMAVTWWCYDSNDTVREVTVDWGRGKGDLAPGGRVSYNPPNNDTGRYYVQFTRKDGHLPGTTCNSHGKTVIFLTFGGRPQPPD